MNTQFDKTKELIKRLKEKNPIYQNILNFYEEILEAQKDAKFDLDVIEIKYDVKDLQFREGFPLIEKKDFIIDIPSSAGLFESICRPGKKATEKMRENIQAIEEAIAINALNLKEMLRRHHDEKYLSDIAGEFDIDRPILKFLIHASVQPSLEANARKLKGHVDLKNWLRGYCPICGSPPQISELKGEGQRYYLCSFCGFYWPGERIKCPFCDNREHDKLHYFYEDGKEAYRVDQCDNCRQYVKTIDSRKLDYEPDLILEDIVTIHLDILAVEKGFKKPVSSPWGP